MSKNTQISELINYISVDGSGNVVLSSGQLVATQSYVSTAITNLVNSAPSTLDTLNELATALGNDPNFATTVVTSIGTKQAQLNGTGFVKVTGTTVSYDNSTYLTTSSASSTYLPLTGGTLTGPLTGTTATFNLNASSILTLISAGTNASMIKAASGDELYLGGNDTWQLRFNSGNILMDNGGNLGINTGSPLERFSVNGNIHIAGVGNSLLFDTDASGRAISQYVTNLYEFHIVNARGNSSRFVLGNGSISLGTSSTPQFYINTSTGNIGAGTTSPLKNLHVYASNGSGIGIGRNLTNDNFSANLFFYPSNLTSDKRNWAITTYFARPELMEFRRSSTITSDPYDNGVTVMALDGINDRVGFGTLSPSTKVQILGNTLTPGTQVTYALSVGNGSNYDLTFGTDSSFSYIQSWTSKPLLINGQGNSVGIGINGTPGYTLEVNGDAKSNRLYLSTNANNIFTKPNGSTYSRFLYSGSNLNIVFSGGTTANNGAFGVNNFEDTARIFNVENNGNTYVNGKLAVAAGYSTNSQISVNGSVKINRSIYNWYQESYVGNGTYLHIKTNLWCGGAPSGNTEYTMSLFKGYMYAYSSPPALEGTIVFHNWDGSFYNIATTGNLFVTAYRSSDGYVVLVTNSGSGEAGLTIDWHQAYAYGFRDRIRTASKLYSATTGGY